MNKKKLIIVTSILIIVIALIIAMVVYYNQDKYADINVQTNDIMNNIYTTLGSEANSLLDLDEQQVSEKYNIDISKLDNYIIKEPMMNIRADAIAIIKVKDIKDVQYVKNKLNDRVKSIQNTYENYLQDQYELAQNAIVISKGRYILMSISDKNDEIENVFNSYFINKK